MKKPTEDKHRKWDDLPSLALLHFRYIKKKCPLLPSQQNEIKISMNLLHLEVLMPVLGAETF